eukprot:5159821-Pleurochrysis_carterae.AAC.1
MQINRASWVSTAPSAASTVEIVSFRRGLARTCNGRKTGAGDITHRSEARCEPRSNLHEDTVSLANQPAKSCCVA